MELCLLNTKADGETFWVPRFLCVKRARTKVDHSIPWTRRHENKAVVLSQAVEKCGKITSYDVMSNHLEDLLTV